MKMLDVHAFLWQSLYGHFRGLMMALVLTMPCLCAGGLGINLYTADIVVLFDSDWCASPPPSTL